MVIVLHAMVVASTRFVNADSYGLADEEVLSMVQRSRSTVVLNAMDDLSVENLQALVIVAFDDVSLPTPHDCVRR
jgi:hypothetical protein